jgi:uncharacterized protein (DUF736 family)
MATAISGWKRVQSSVEKFLSIDLPDPLEAFKVSK